MTKLHSKIDQVNLKINIEKWTTENPHDNFYFRKYCDDDAADDDDNDDGDDDDHSSVLPTFSAAEDDDIDLPCRQPGKGLLFCHQTQWQQQLLQRYGAEICLLDAMYKTSRYALPLFFVCVRLWHLFLFSLRTLDLLARHFQSSISGTLIGVH